MCASEFSFLINAAKFPRPSSASDSIAALVEISQVLTTCFSVAFTCKISGCAVAGNAPPASELVSATPAVAS